jgi:hypothetical protein
MKNTITASQLMNDYMSKNATSFNSSDWYLLVDGAQLQAPDLLALRSEGAREILADLEEFEHLEGASPWLIALSGSARVSKVIDAWWTKNPEACSWLYCAAGTTVLTNHLRRQVKARVEDGRILTLRFWDARVFLALQHPELASINLRLVSEVAYWFAAPQSVLVAAKRTNPATDEAELHNITKPQQDRLAQLLLPYAVLGELKETMPEMLSLFARREKYSTSTNLIAAAQGYGLEALSDIVSFASLGFDFHPEFHKHPDIEPKLSELRGGKELDEVIDSINPKTWEELSKRYPKSKQALEI